MSHYQLRVAASLETLLEPSEGPVYREIDPPPDLAAFVGCFWISEAPADRCQRILPDGCIDLLFYSRGSQLVDARVVGAMTRFHDVSLRGGESILGVRFQPGMAGTCLPCDLPSLNDTTALEKISSQFGGPFPPNPTRTKLATLYNMLRHSNEVYGYMCVYLRLKGIVPPSSAPE